MHDMVWYGSVWYGKRDVAWQGTVWHGMGGVTWHGMYEWCDMTWQGMDGRVIVWKGMVWMA